MAIYEFRTGTLAQYQAALQGGTIKDAALYFISDTKQIYKGENLLNEAVEVVTDFPLTGAQGKLYVHELTLEAKTYNGSSWMTVSPAVVTGITEDTIPGALATVSAIKNYLAGQLTVLNAVADVNYDETAQTFTVSYVDGSESKPLALKGVLTGAEYNAETGDFTFTSANGESIVVNTPKENFLASASYDETNHVLTLTLTDGTEVTLNLEQLIDTYIGDETSSVAVTVTGNTITADVKISSKEGNALSVVSEEGKEGLYVEPIDLSNHYTKDEVNELLSWKEITD